MDLHAIEPTRSRRRSRVGRLKFDFHTAAGGARAAADPVEVEGGIRLEEALSREPAEVVEESRVGALAARRRPDRGAAAVVVAALGPRTRARAARPEAAAAPRVAAVACVESKFTRPARLMASSLAKVSRTA